jgi:transcriptional regulator with AAA-type ATPase domain
MGDLHESEAGKPSAGHQRGGRITVTTRFAESYSAEVGPPSPAERRFALIFSWGPVSAVRFLEPGEEILIGREEPADILLEDPSVSRQHVRFFRKDERIWAEDLSSHNGTLLRGRRIGSEGLEPGDELRIGETRVLIACTGASGNGRAQGGGRSRDPVLVSGSLTQLYEEAAVVARTELSVLVLGETGTGKEHVARTMHGESLRQARPFVVVDCATVAPHLLESTLFGPEAGAKECSGAFAEAHLGTLFLDDVGELTPAAQSTLFSALDVRRVRRGTALVEVPWNVRVISATYCDLETMIEDGTFRRDLYDRLGGAILTVPPLRERPEAIGPLVNHFLAIASDDWSLSARSVAPDALSALARYYWPGNVRQLKQAVERAALLCTGPAISLAALPAQISTREPPQPIQVAPPDPTLSLRDQIRTYEVALIERALERAAGDRRAAAKLLRVPLRTLLIKMRTTVPPPSALPGR